MSTKTLRKRIALTSVTALFAGMLSVASAPVASAAVLHVLAGQANPIMTAEVSDTSTYVATVSNTSGSAALATVSAIVLLSGIEDSAKSTGLLTKDTTTGTAQTVTMVAGGTLSLYSLATTDTAFTATAGSFATSATSSAASAVTFGDPASKVHFAFPAADIVATGIAALWTAPSTAGTYTISKYYATNGAKPTLSSPSSGSLGGQITVTVVAASAGGAYSSVQSACFTNTVPTGGTVNSGAYTADSTTSLVNNGGQWYIKFALNDAYGQDLASGSLVATATNGGILNISTAGDNAALSAGAGSTAVVAGSGSAGLVRVDQATAGAPLSTTVTISYNGTTVCTKTVSIGGAAASVTVSSVATGDISTTGTSFASTKWLDEGAVQTGGARAGMFYVQLKDSAGNIVLPGTSAEFTMDPATTTTTIPALSVLAQIATSTSSTSAGSKSAGVFSCGPVAGSSAVVLRHTAAATGVTIKSAPFTARCADNAATYTVSTDKASYLQGDIGTLTVKFLDSKGNAANSVTAVGASTLILPMLTLVSATGAADAIADVNGEQKYTFTVGTSSGMTAGTFSGIVDFTALTGAGATKATPTYKLSTGGDTTTNADVLKSIVALIASINKQIQALQKLILKR